MSFTVHPNSPNKQAIPLVEEAFRGQEARLRELLPELSDELQVYVYAEDLIQETGTGGYAYSPTVLSLAIDNDFKDKEKQLSALVGTIYHESYHLTQGHTGNETKAPATSALDSAIYEGCATVFERTYAGVEPLWGDYSMHSEEELRQWCEALSRITPDEWLGDEGEVWQRWSFYDAEDGQRWKAYKVGTWVVERCLRETGKDIRDLRLMAASDIRT